MVIRGSAGTSGVRRLVERGLVCGVIVLVIAALDSRIRALQAQAEVAALRSTLGALRTALVLDHMQWQLRPQNKAIERNPFLLLEQIPANYAGTPTQQGALEGLPGQWVFDPVCACVGYTPAHAQWTADAGPVTAVWFHTSAAPGPLQLTASARYTWQDETLD